MSLFSSIILKSSKRKIFSDKIRELIDFGAILKVSNEIKQRTYYMAHHQSTIKRIRQTVKRTERNRYYRTRYKNIVKAVVVAAESNDKVAAMDAFKVANRQIHKLVSKGFIKKSTAARKVSRLNKLVNSIEAA
jgi:small subunit ribosomal protein S20